MPIPYLNKKLKTSVNWQLLTGDVQLGTLEVQNGFVQLVKKGKSRNFDAFLKKIPPPKNK
jgi:hypothetical protein